MALRSPTTFGLTVTPNAAGDAQNPAASDAELQAHRFWGRFSSTANLPNATSNAAASPAFDLMRPGDVGYVQTGVGAGELYVLVDRGTSSGADATWDAFGGGGGLTPSQHAALRQLIHFLDDGPGAGFASGAVKDIAYSGALITSEIWYEDATKTQRIVDLTITYTDALPTTEVWRMYDTDGVTILVTLTDAITYSGALETTRTRTWV